MRDVLLSAFLGFIGCVVAAIFGAMLTTPEPTVVQNLKVLWRALGLSPRTGFFSGLGIAAIAVVLFTISLRNRKSSGHAIVEAKRIVGSVIEDNYSERSDSAVKANVIRDSSVQRNKLKSPGGKADG